MQQVLLLGFYTGFLLVFLHSMMEAEIIAVLEGFKAIARLEDRNGRKVANKLVTV